MKKSVLPQVIRTTSKIKIYKAYMLGQAEYLTKMNQSGPEQAKYLSK